MQKRIGILRGGIGKNYHSSIQKGGKIISHFLENLSDKWKVFDILVDKEGTWHINGVPTEPAELMHRIDIVWNTAHPEITTTLRRFSIPSVGIDPFHSAIQESKEILREHMSKIGLNIPRALVIPTYQKDFDGDLELFAVQKAKDVHAKFSAPWMVKSFTPDKNMAIHLAKTFSELVDAILDGAKRGDSIEVEEFISGKIASAHSVPQFRGENIYVFPLGKTFDSFSNTEKETVMQTVKDLHSHLGDLEYLRSDFVLNPRGKIYLLSMESIPDLSPGSHFHEACESVGAKMHHVVEHILKQV
jgi:D-alanine-D-alanine ligase-like ATP-grasp enzyme